MYSLFIDTLSSPAFVCLFDNDKNITDSIIWEAKHAEFNTLTESIDTLLSRNAIEYSHLQWIICIVWPGGFTGIRVTTLVANTLGYSYWIPLYPVTVNDFFRVQTAPLPWILPLTKTEVLLWEKQNQLSPTIVRKNDLESLTQYSSNQSSSLLAENISCIQANNYILFLKDFILPPKVSILQPLYARDPNVIMKK